MSQNTKSKKKITISEYYYPSDKDLFDFLRGQKISKRRLKEFLDSRGILCQFSSASSYAEVICGMVLEDKDIQELMAFSNVREHKFKASSIKISAANLTSDSIVKALSGNPFGDIELDAKVKLPPTINSLAVDSKTGEMVLKQRFSKIDYTKSTLFQEVEHELIIKIMENPKDKTFEMTVHSSAPEAEILVGKIKDRIFESVKKLTFHEIMIQELVWENRNKFFDDLIRSLELDLVSVEEVKLSNSIHDKGANKGSDDDDNEETDDNDLADSDDQDEDEGSKKKEPVIKRLTVQGESILDVPEIANWKKDGYYIRSVTGTFRGNAFSGKTVLAMSIQVEFTNSGIFQVQTKKCQVEDDLGKYSPYNLDVNQKESITKSVNKEAFAIFDKLRVAKLPLEAKQAQLLPEQEP